MIDITAKDCGLWISANDVSNYIDFSIKVIDIAIEHGYVVDDSWGTDCAVLMSDEKDDDELIGKMNTTYYDALDYLNAQLYDSNVSFYVNPDGLFLTTRS